MKYVNPTTRVGGVEQVVVAERVSTSQVDDAPYDDEQYVRINGEWVPVDTPEIIPDTLAPAPPTALDSTGTISPNGAAVSYELTWTAPTTNEDGTPITDLAYYVVRWHYAGEGAWFSFVSNEASSVITGLELARPVEWEVAARDISGNDSTWASDTITGLADTVGPEKPSAPILTSRMGVLSARWNGFDYVGDAPPRDFSHLKVYMSATTGGPWALAGELTGASSLHITDVLVGDLRYVTFVAYDTSGNSSLRSAEASITVSGVSGADIDDEVFTDIDASAQSKADAAETAAIAAAAADSEAKSEAAKNAAIAAAAADATAKAEAAEAAATAAAATDAQTKANAAAAAAETAAKNYADLQAAGAEQAAIDAAALDAQSKADAAEAAATAAAAADATAKAEAAEAAATAAAAADAQAKANAAQSAAIAAAALDATNKANLAEAAAIDETSSRVTAGTVVAGQVAATAIDGMTVTGALLQSDAEPTLGVKFDTLGLRAFNAGGVKTFDVNASTGDVLLTGAVRTAASGARAELTYDAPTSTHLLAFWNSITDAGWRPASIYGNANGAPVGSRTSKLGLNSGQKADGTGSRTGIEVGDAGLWLTSTGTAYGTSYVQMRPLDGAIIIDGSVVEINGQDFSKGRYLRGKLATDLAVSCTSGVWTTINAWTREADGISNSASTFTIAKSGSYQLTAAISFESNATGARGVRPIINGAGGQNALFQAIASFQGFANYTQEVYLASGDTVVFQAYQNSGATLRLRGDANGLYSTCSLRRVGN